MNAGRVETGLTAVDAYSQKTGACGGGIHFWGNCWEWTYIHGCEMDNTRPKVAVPDSLKR